MIIIMKIRIANGSQYTAWQNFGHTQIILILFAFSCYIKYNKTPKEISSRNIDSAVCSFHYHL